MQVKVKVQMCEHIHTHPEQQKPCLQLNFKSWAKFH